MRTQGSPRIRELFGQALTMPAEDRDGFLASQCQGDLELLEEVHALLAVRDRAGTFLDPQETSVSPILNRDQGHLPERIGRYRVIKELGRGGMGVVYLAERDDKTFTKKVALKLIKEGISGAEALDRFRAERQVLAGLEHVNIARILDAGDTDDGNPYYVMEYVEGERLDTYCRRKSLGLHQTLSLFQQVCSAVDYLHSQQVLHRDLKPNNVLVTATGKVKLLDFGVAKLLGSSAVDLTAVGRAPLTPAYASPEQLAGLPVSPRADVYSLGVMLFQLLTEELPNAVKPSPPSGALSDRLSDFKRSVSGDLDMVVLKALAINPDHRYGSPEELSADLERFREDRPVVARRSSTLVRLAKLIRRNRFRTGMAAVVLFLIIIGGRLAVEAARNRRNVTAREAEIRGLLDSLAHPTFATGDLDPKKVDEIVAEIKRLRASLTTPWLEGGNLTRSQENVRREVLDRSHEYLNSLRAVSDHNPVIAQEIGYTYIRLGELEQTVLRGASGVAATQSFQTAAQMLHRAAESNPADGDLQRRLTEVERRLSVLGVPSTPPQPDNPHNTAERLAPEPVKSPTLGFPAPTSPVKGPNSTSRTASPVVVAPQIDQFRVEPSSVRPGQTARLSWALSGDAREVWITPGGSISLDANGLLVNPTITTNYILTVRGDNSEVSQTLQVVVVPFAPPVIERFTVEPRTVVPGQTARLSWSIKGDISSLAITPGPTIARTESGLEIHPEKTTEYTLQAAGPAGVASMSATIEVVTDASKTVGLGSGPAPVSGSTLFIGSPIGDPVREAEGLFSEAQLTLRAKKYEEAAVLFGKAARLNVHWKEPLIERGKINNKLGRFREAIEDCNQALVIDSLDPYVLNMRGYAHHSLNQLREAKTDFDSAIRIKPDFAEAYLNRGNLEWQQGDKTDANADFRMFRSLQDATTRR